MLASLLSWFTFVKLHCRSSLFSCWQTLHFYETLSWLLYNWVDSCSIVIEWIDVLSHLQNEFPLFLFLVKKHFFVLLVKLQSWQMSCQRLHGHLWRKSGKTQTNDVTFCGWFLHSLCISWSNRWRHYLALQDWARHLSAIVMWCDWCLGVVHDVTNTLPNSLTWLEAARHPSPLFWLAPGFSDLVTLLQFPRQTCQLPADVMPFLERLKPQPCLFMKLARHSLDCQSSLSLKVWQTDRSIAWRHWDRSLLQQSRDSYLTRVRAALADCAIAQPLSRANVSLSEVLRHVSCLFPASQCLSADALKR